MAIKFLESVGLKQQELKNVSLEKAAANPTAYQGRVFFNTATNLLSFYGGTTTGWVTLDGTGNVDEVTLDATTSVSTGNPISTSTTSDVVTIKAHHYGGDTLEGFVPTLAVASSLKYLDGSGAWTVPEGNMTSWELDGNNTSPQTVLDGELVLVKGEVGLIEGVASSADIITVNHKNIARVNASVTPAQLAEGDTFPTFASITSEAAGDLGHISSLDVQTVTVPSTSSNNTTYALTSAAAVMTLTGSDSTTETVTLLGTALQVTLGGASANTIDISLPAAVTIVGTLDVGAGATSLGGALIANSGSALVTLSSTLEQNSGAGAIAIGGVTNIPIISKVHADYAQSGAGSDQQWVNKDYVDVEATTSIIFQGSYAADGTEDVPTGVAILKGFAYAVTAAGVGNGTPFTWSPALDEGDFIYANVKDPSSESDWTQIQNNVNKATDSVYGIAKYIDANGWATPVSPDGTPKLKNRGAASGGTASAIPSLVMDSDNFGLVDSISDLDISIAANIVPASSQVNDFNTASEAVIDDYVVDFTIGSGATSYTVTHNFTTYDVFVEVFDNNKNNVFCKVTRPTNLTVFVEFSSAVTALAPMNVVCNSMVIA